MSEALTREDYVALSEEERMRARLIGLQLHLETAEGVGPLRQRGVVMAEGGAVGPVSADAGNADVAKGPTTSPPGHVRKKPGTRTVKTSVMLFTKGKKGVASHFRSSVRVTRAAEEAGITTEQARLFLQGLEKNSAG